MKEYLVLITRVNFKIIHMETHIPGGKNEFEDPAIYLLRSEVCSNTSKGYLQKSSSRFLTKLILASPK
jgi:hypothetical protein